MTENIQRKKHTGESGNGGQFGSKVNTPDDIALAGGTPGSRDDFEGKYTTEESEWGASEIEGVDPNRVWTILDTGHLEVLAAGVHTVNRTSSTPYVITAEPWSDAGEEYYWGDSMEDKVEEYVDYGTADEFDEETRAENLRNLIILQGDPDDAELEQSDDALVAAADRALGTVGSVETPEGRSAFITEFRKALRS